MVCRVSFFFFKDTATTEIYTLSLHDALPIWAEECRRRRAAAPGGRPALRRRRLPGAHGSRLRRRRPGPVPGRRDRKSTRLNSSHANISYAVFCLKKKKNHHTYCAADSHTTTS